VCNAFSQNLKKIVTFKTMLAAIWKQLEELKPKENEVKPVITSICRECDGIKVITREGLPTCSVCGLVDSYFVDDTAEWTSGITDDGKVNDPSRCGNPNANPELFSQNWGKGTIISTQHSSTYENKRMAKINFHMSMNHKDRSLFHAYRDIDEACHTLQDSVLKDAKILYRKFNNEKLTRGAVRLGIKANCVLYACRLAQTPRTTKEIADMFGIQSKDISRTTQIFKDNILGVTKKNYVTKSYDVMQRLLNSFEITREERLKCNKMCAATDNCVELMSKTPNSVASAIIYIVIGHRVTKSEMCDRCSVSIPTLNKIEIIIKKHLELLN
jgi:transcription initiation factor TFIIIB Brf1 subunit/transcription initiation factor TFIIB|tara:strand:- start:1646 stop:2629 length:984 start_codon:yes stop_codon:yes gene_type:complete